MAYPPRPSRRTSFQQQANAGNAISPAMLDAEHNDFVEQIDQLNTFVRGVTTASGTLKNQSTATAQALAGAQRFVATSNQTTFLTTIPYVAAFNNLNVDVAVAGLDLDSNSVTVSNNGGFLQVVIPAQPLNTVVQIQAFESGAGILTRLANTASSADGANMIGVQDSGALIAATTVEGALAEIVTNLNAFITNVGLVSNLMKRDGTTAATAAIPMGGFKITGIQDGTAAQDAVSFAQLSAVNQTLTTLANSFVKKDGTNSMTGPLNFGTQRGINLAAPTTGTDAANKTYVDTSLGSAAPVGAMFLWGTGVAPSGWLICNGAAVSRTTYAALFALWGTTFGAGDGTTTFNLYNPSGRALVGAGSGTGGGASGSGAPTGGAALTPRVVGQWFGEETHTMTATELAAHTHSFTPSVSGTGGVLAGASSGGFPAQVTTSVGNSTPFNVVQPSSVVTIIVKF